MPRRRTQPRVPTPDPSKAMTLIPGVLCPTPTAVEEAERIEVLRATIHLYLPEFVKLVKESGADLAIIHQDAFAAGYDTDEYTLLGMAVKYAGLHGKSVTIHGTNHETFPHKT